MSLNGYDFFNFFYLYFFLVCVCNCTFNVDPKVQTLVFPMTEAVSYELFDSGLVKFEFTLQTSEHPQLYVHSTLLTMYISGVD